MVTGNSTILLPAICYFWMVLLCPPIIHWGKPYDQCTAITTFIWSLSNTQSLGMSERCGALQWAGPSMSKRGGDGGTCPRTSMDGQPSDGESMPQCFPDTMIYMTQE